ncbi:hypothetical protein D3C72_1968670 [compost metagenome]
MRHRARRARHLLYGVGHVRRLNDRKARHGQRRFHERAVGRFNPARLGITHLHRRARDTHPHPGLLQRGIVRMCGIPDRCGGSVVPFLVSVPDRDVQGHDRLLGLADSMTTHRWYGLACAESVTVLDTQPTN